MCLQVPVQQPAARHSQYFTSGCNGKEPDHITSAMAKLPMTHLDFLDSSTCIGGHRTPGVKKTAVFKHALLKTIKWLRTGHPCPASPPGFVHCCCRVADRTALWLVKVTQHTQRGSWSGSACRTATFAEQHCTQTQQAQLGLRKLLRIWLVTRKGLMQSVAMVCMPSLML